MFMQKFKLVILVKMIAIFYVLTSSVSVSKFQQGHVS